jgi:hypothetical protein
MTFQKKLSAVVASSALIFTGFTPAMAAPVSVAGAMSQPIDMNSLAWTSEVEKAERWRGNRGYRGYRGHRHRRGRIDGGDVVAGILILGGIAAIASAASKNKKDRRYDDRDYRNSRDRDYRQRDYRGDDRGYDNRRSNDRDEQSSRGTGNMDLAINACSNAAEIQAGDNARVSEIRAVARDGSGWRVEGDLTGGNQTNFLCGATGSRVDYVQLGNGSLALAN